MHFTIVLTIKLVVFLLEPIKDILKLLEKASHSANRRSLGFSAAEIALGLMHVATNDGNKRLVRLICMR